GVALDDLDTRLPAGRHRLGETIVDGDAHGCIAIGYVVVDLVGGHVLHGDVHDSEPGQDVNDGGRERIVGGDTGRDRHRLQFRALGEPAEPQAQYAPESERGGVAADQDALGADALTQVAADDGPQLPHVSPAGPCRSDGGTPTPDRAG